MAVEVRLPTLLRPHADGASSVTAQGATDARNDIMLYAIVEADSHEAAAAPFEGHPHLQIPQSSIEIMEIHPIGGM